MDGCLNFGPYSLYCLASNDVLRQPLDLQMAGMTALSIRQVLRRSVVCHLSYAAAQAKIKKIFSKRLGLVLRVSY